MIGKDKREFVINSIRKKYQLRLNLEKTKLQEKDFVVLLLELDTNGKRKQILRFDESSHPHTSNLYESYHVHNFSDLLPKERIEILGKNLSQDEKIEKSIDYLKSYADAHLPREDSLLFKSQLPGIEQQIRHELNSPQWGKRTTTISFSIGAILYDPKDSKKEKQK